MPDLEQDADSQDLAETFDETNSTRDGYDIAHPDTDPDVFDVTSAEDDGDEDEPEDVEDIDFDDISEGELEVMLEEDDGVDSDDSIGEDAADQVAEDEDSPTDFEAVDQPAPRRSSPERRRDSDLAESLPASDPLPAAPGAD